MSWIVQQSATLCRQFSMHYLQTVEKSRLADISRVAESSKLPVSDEEQAFASVLAELTRQQTMPTV